MILWRLVLQGVGLFFWVAEVHPSELLIGEVLSWWPVVIGPGCGREDDFLVCSEFPGQIIVDLCSVFQAGAVGHVPGPNFGRKSAQHREKLQYIF
jgi:hypothetical protein